MSKTHVGSSGSPGPDDIQNLLRASIDGPDAVRVSAFVLTLDPASDHPYRNYAVPVADSPITGSAVTDLIDAFRTRGLVPRLEFVTPAPLLEQALSAAGFTVERRLPVMVVAPENFQLPAGLADIDVGVVADEPSLLAAAQVQNAAYQQAGTTSGDVNRLRRLVEAGGRVVLAHLDGLPVGSGLSTAPALGASEVGQSGCWRGSGGEESLLRWQQRSPTTCWRAGWRRFCRPSTPLKPSSTSAWATSQSLS